MNFSSPLRSWFINPISCVLLSTELLELHSLLEWVIPIFPRSAIPRRSRLTLRLVTLDILLLFDFIELLWCLVATGTCWNPLKCRDSLRGLWKPPYLLLFWPLCKLIDCCNFNRRRISSSESELEFSSYGYLLLPRIIRKG